MTRAFLPTLFEEEGNALRSFFDWPKFCSSDVEVYEDEDAVMVEAPLPGLKADEIEVSLKEGILSIQGEKKGENKRRKWASKFSYAVFLPHSVDESAAVEAEAKDGILTVRLPKSRSSKPLKIAVNSK